MLKYQYVFCGDFYRTKIIDKKIYDDHDYYNFQIEVPIPIDYITKEKAVNCPCSLRFEIENGHVVLKIYSDWEQGLGENNKWYEHVAGNVIDIIKWEEWWRYKIARSKVPSKDMCPCVDANTDFIPNATPWDELFDVDNLPKGWCNTVESQAYFINIVEI